MDKVKALLEQKGYRVIKAEYASTGNIAVSFTDEAAKNDITSINRSLSYERGIVTGHWFNSITRNENTYTATFVA